MASGALKWHEASAQTNTAQASEPVLAVKIKQ